MDKKFPSILNSLLAEVACDRIYNRLNTDIYDYGESPMIDEQYMKSVFLDPGEITLANFNEMYQENKEEVYEDYPVLSFIKESVCKDYAVEKVIGYGLNFMRAYHDYYESDILTEESSYGKILQLINSDNIYAV
jgi:hypothetical protein